MVGYHVLTAMPLNAVSGAVVVDGERPSGADVQNRLF